MAKSRIKWGEHLVELLVVIIGISIAFAIENYSANRKEKGQELLHLKGIADDLQTDLRSFEENIGYNQNTLRFLKRFNELISARDRTHDSLNFLLLRAGWISNYDPRDISYQSLKSSGGLDKITNFELRRTLVYHYEQKLNQVAFLNGMHSRNLEQYVTPILLRYSDFTSRDRVDPSFYNTRENANVFSGLEGLLTNKIQEYEEVLGFTENMLKEVQEEISKF